MRHNRPTKIIVIAVLVASTTALVLRSWLQVVLRDHDLDKLFAADLSYLISFPILLLLLFPVWRTSSIWIRSCLDVTVLDVRFVVRALALGLLLRAAWWCQLVSGISLGLYGNRDPALVSGPVFRFQCPDPQVIIIGFVVMAILVPLIEEVVHRGFVQSALNRYGSGIAIVGSAAIFTVFHPPENWGFVFFAGLVFGTQFRITKSLWSSLLTHATINGIIQIDWRCLQGQWNPHPSDIPVVESAVPALVLLLACVTSIGIILAGMHRGEDSPR
ncbi:MAG: CPBP family intramembrane metalloprotease [Gammaproteobacteria bacterium]|nr:CPBP family intramembrane metalloprotease [Gammaproteobacteria bacterium]